MLIQKALQREESWKMQQDIEARTRCRGLGHEAEKSGLYWVIGELVKISEQEKAGVKLCFTKINLSVIEVTEHQSNAGDIAQ